MSLSARHRLLYTKRTVRNKKEARILKNAHCPFNHKLSFFYYIGGIVAFMTWPALGKHAVVFSYLGMGYVFTQFLRMNWSLVDRLTYEREQPVKSITEVHKEFAHYGLRLSAYSIVLTVFLFIAKKALGF